MIPIYRAPVIHVEVTNACNLECSNCTRHIGHHRRPFVMDIEMVEKAILSLTTPFDAGFENFEKGFPGIIGIMGGEPTAHPKFEEICRVMQKYVPREKAHLWTDGYKYDRHKQSGLIDETFCAVMYNDHTDQEVGWHQPLLVAAEELLSEDRELMWRLINNCWVQWRWAASITPKGGFFCEVAASLDMLFDGPGGYTIEPGWWAKNPNQFFDQVERSCTRCSAAIPMPAVSAHADYDLVSPGNLALLEKAGSGRASKGHVKVFDEKLTREQIEEHILHGWTPWNHRPYVVYGDKEKTGHINYRPELVQITT
jgi:hypothetical protein